jgi:hypothetical protein
MNVKKKKKAKVGLSQNCRLLCAFVVDVEKFSYFLADAKEFFLQD